MHISGFVILRCHVFVMCLDSTLNLHKLTMSRTGLDVQFSLVELSHQKFFFTFYDQK